MAVTAAACLALTSCKDKDPDPVYTETTVTTSDGEEVTNSSAKLSGSFALTDNPKAKVEKAGFKYMSSVGAAEWTDVAATVSGTNFTANTTELDPEVEYSFYAYVIEEGATTEIKGETKQFTTEPNPSTTEMITVASSSEMSVGTTSAIVLARCYPGDGETVEEIGIIYWKKSDAGDESKWKTVKNGEVVYTNYSIELTGLTESTAYQYTAYAKIAGRIALVMAAEDQIRDLHTYGTAASGVTLNLGGFGPPPNTFQTLPCSITGGSYTLPGSFNASNIEKVVLAYKFEDDGQVFEYSSMGYSNGTITQSNPIQIFKNQVKAGKTFSVWIRMYFKAESGFGPADSNVVRINTQ